MAKKTHKITAIKMVEHKGIVTLSGLTQSPRGTRTILKSVKRDLPKKDKKKRKETLQAAVDELLGNDE